MPIGIYKRTEKHKQQLVKARSFINEESRKKFSKKMKGKIPWNKGKTGVQVSSRKGKKFSKEICEKMSKSKIGKYGELHNAWKNSSYKTENLKIRHSFEYYLWRKSCFTRDNYTCQKTGQIGGKLEVHHINNFVDFPELRTSIENGVTLSKYAHRQFHKIYGKRYNTREQLLEFLNK